MKCSGPSTSITVPVGDVDEIDRQQQVLARRVEHRDVALQPCVDRREHVERRLHRPDDGRVATRLRHPLEPDVALLAQPVVRAALERDAVVRRRPRERGVRGIRRHAQILPAATAYDASRMAGVDEFFERVAALRREGAAFAIATVVSRRGPVSSHMGDRAIVFGDGVMEGFVGGSCSREVVRRQALDALAAGEPRLVSIRPDDELALAGDGLVVPMTCGSKGSVDVYIEPFVQARTVAIVGLTPVADALVRLAETLEYRVVRAVTQEELRDVDDAVSLEELGARLAEMPTGARASLGVVVASQGHYDEPALEIAVRARSPYIALVASRRRGAEVREALLAAGTGRRTTLRRSTTRRPRSRRPSSRRGRTVDPGGAASARIRRRARSRRTSSRRPAAARRSSRSTRSAGWRSSSRRTRCRRRLTARWSTSAATAAGRGTWRRSAPSPAGG